MAAVGFKLGMANRCFVPSQTAVRRTITAVAPRTSQMTSYVQPSCSFLGGSVSTSLFRPTIGRGSLVVVAGGVSMGCTLQGTNRKRRRVSGYRKRKQTAAGRKVLAARRKRGRAVICPASMKKSGGKK